MYICQNCGQAYQTPVNFCSRCGNTAIVNQGGIQPPYSPYTASSYPMTPAPAEKGGRGAAIVGMIFGLIAMFMSFVMVGMAAELADNALSYYLYRATLYEEILGFIVGYSIVMLPFSIVGLVLSCKAKALKGMAIAGRIMTILSLVLWGISCLICLG